MGHSLGLLTHVIATIYLQNLTQIIANHQEQKKIPQKIHKKENHKNKQEGMVSAWTHNNEIMN